MNDEVNNSINLTNYQNFTPTKSDQITFYSCIPNVSAIQFMGLSMFMPLNCIRQDSTLVYRLRPAGIISRKF